MSVDIIAELARSASDPGADAIIAEHAESIRFELQRNSKINNAILLLTSTPEGRAVLFDAVKACKRVYDETGDMGLLQVDVSDPVERLQARTWLAGKRVAKMIGGMV